MTLKVKTRERNRNNKRPQIEPFDWFIERIQTRMAFGWLSERPRVKKLHARELLESIDTSLWRHTATDWSIEQCLLHIKVFFGGKTKSPCFDLFIHWLIKQITNTYLNHFSRSYENRYMICVFLGDIHFKMTWPRLFSHGTGRISTGWVFVSLGVAFTRNHLNRLKFRRLAVQSSVWTGRKHWKVACELVTEF